MQFLIKHWEKSTIKKKSFQSNDDVSKMKANEFTMQSQEEGMDSTIEDTTNSIVEDVEEGITNRE